MIRTELNRGWAVWLFLAAACLLGGCVHGPVAYKPAAQATMDRRNVDYPAGFDLKLVASGFTAPVAIAFDDAGTKLVAEAGFDAEPRIWAIKGDHTLQLIYPFSRRIPFSPVQPGFQIYGPIGGMVVDHHKIYVSHRDRDGYGVITQFGFDGSHKTITSGWPAQGDYGLTDLAVLHDPGRREGDRLFFACGSATNSGIVGLDNMMWLRRYRDFCDQSAVAMDLLGLRSLTKNPFASIFIPGGGETADTGPFQPFAKSDLTRVPATPAKRPNSVVASVAIEGGNERIHAYGFRYPRGLAISDRGTLYFTNDGMEMRGSRPVKDDPCALIHIYTSGPPTPGGFPDYSASLEEINQQKFQPPMTAFPRNNVPKVGFLLEHGEGSGFQRPDPGDWENLSRTRTAVFPPLSGAAKLAFPPAEGPLASAFRGEVFVALSGDTAPFGTGDYPLVRPVGYKVVRVNLDTGKVQDFIFNVGMLPGSQIERRGFVGLERPVDVKVGPDGALYVLDMGEIEYKTDGRQKVARAGGKLFKLVPSRAATTQP